MGLIGILEDKRVLQCSNIGLTNFYASCTVCAAPGSKTFQLLEMIHQSKEPGLLPRALVVANDVNAQRCDLLIHNMKRMCTANLIVTNHEAQNFPDCRIANDLSEIYKKDCKPQRLEFDRVLCDVPCSGDGTIRKGHDMWRKWLALNLLFCLLLLFPHSFFLRTTICSAVQELRHGEWTSSSPSRYFYAW
jgi:hypothetical protein